MNNVVAFVPRHDRDAERNLADFIHHCRHELTTFGADLDWDANYWPEAGLLFGNIHQKSRILEVRNALQQPFRDFAKAYLRYRQTHRPANAAFMVTALKCIERSLVQYTGEANISGIGFATLDQAAEIARENYKATTCYGTGRELAALAKFVSDRKLIAGNIDWKNPFKRQTDTVRTGHEAKARRDAKLPAQVGLDAIADIFSANPSGAKDIYTTSTVAMLLCAPSRISEIQELPLDCEVEEAKSDGTVAYGWRFRPKKGGSPMIKWIPDVMVDIAKEAIDRLRKLTEEARAVARWLEQDSEAANSNFPLPEFVGREDFSRQEIWSFIGRFPADLPKYMRVVKARTDVRVDLVSLHRWIKSHLSKRYRHFPWIDERRNTRFSELLYCLQDSLLSTHNGTKRLVLWQLDSNILNIDLQAPEGYRKLPFFQRHGFNQMLEEPLKITSHQFRHLIATMAMRGGLSQPEIARWRGSTDMRQNRAYNQMSEFELVARLRERDPTLISSKSEIEIAEQIKVALPVTTEEFNALQKTTAHITEVGFCIHDFVMSPCQRFRDCLNCTEQVCVKGDRRLGRLDDKLALVEHQLEAARDGAAEGLYGADPWTHIQTQTRDRMKELISIRNDESIPDGSIIRLANPLEFSPVKRALGAGRAGRLPAPPQAQIGGN